MSENTTPETAAAPAEGAEAPQEANSEAGLPAWAQKELTKLRNEAAAKRVEARDAKQAATDAAAQLTELTGKHTQVSDDLVVTASKLTKLEVALSVGIPGESAAAFAELLQGTTQDEIRAHADKILSVSKTFGATPPPARPVDPSQGLSGGKGQEPADLFGALLFKDLR